MQDVMKVVDREKQLCSTLDEHSNSNGYNTALDRPSKPTAKLYFFRTNNGTSIPTFEAYIKTLPDQGKGEKYTRDILPYQTYMTCLTPAEAEEVAKQPFVRYVDPVVPMERSTGGIFSLL